MIERLKNWAKKNWPIFIITFLGLFLRLLGIDFGKPFRSHPDEVKLVWQALNLLNYQQWSRDAIFAIGTYPPLFTYILAVLFALYNLILLAVGILPSLAAVKEAYYFNPFSYHLIARYLSVFAGTATIPLIYWIGKKLYHKETGLAAAAFLAVVSVHVNHSHFGTVDVLQTFFMMIALAFSVLVWTSGKLKYYLGAGIFISLSAAVKYNGGVIVLPLLLAHIFRSIKDSKIDWPTLFGYQTIVAAIGIIIAFLVACPMPLVDFKEFWGGLVGTARFEQTGKIGSGGCFWSYFTGQHSPGFGFFYDNNFYLSLGYGLFFLFCLGFIFLLLRHKKQDLLTLIIPVVMYATAGHMKYKAIRHLLPMIPLLILIAAEFGFFLIRKLKNNRMRALALLAITGFCLLPPAIKSFRYGLALRQTDTRAIMKNWIEANVPENTKIGLEEFGPPLLCKLDLNLSLIRRSPHYKRVYDVYGLDPGMFAHGKQSTTDYNPVKYLSDHQIKYIVLSSFNRSRYSWKLSRSRYPEVVKAREDFYHWVEENCSLIYQVVPENRFNIFPVLAIYQVNMVTW